MLYATTETFYAYLWLSGAVLTLGWAENVPNNSQTSDIIRLRGLSLDEWPNSCLAPPQPKNGGRKLRRQFCDGNLDCDVPQDAVLPIGSELVYSCDDGYRARGNTEVYCGREGNWSSLPVCEEIRCSALNSLSTLATCTTQTGDRISCDSPVPPGTRAELSCGPGYTKDTNFLTNKLEAVQCNPDGTWEPDPVKCIPVCGRATTHQSPLVINGAVAKLGDFPWHASLYLEKNTRAETKKEFQCGGTIIQPNLVMTAATCIYNEINGQTENPSKLYVMTGNIFRDYDSPFHDPAIVRKHAVKNVYTNCNYHGLSGNYESNIALLELQEAFQISSVLLPACLDLSDGGTEILNPGAYGRVAGFGRTATGASSTILQTVTVPYISYDVCKNSTDAKENEFVIGNDKFCAGYSNGSAVCEGDSGGGLVFKKNDLWYVMGIVSHGLRTAIDTGEKTCGRYSYAAYTRVSNYKSWILEVISDLERYKSHPGCKTNTSSSGDS